MIYFLERLNINLFVVQLFVSTQDSTESIHKLG